jgi:sugar transferase (PEP-CTERM/EpsH1 system associated)
MGRAGMQNGLANLIARLSPDRYEHIICCTRHLDPAKALPLPPVVRVLCIADERGQARFQTAALIRLIRETRPDIVHSRNWGGVEAVLAGRLAGAPAVVHSEHGLDSDPAAPEPRRRRWFRRIAFELADRVVCVSGQLRQVHAKRTGFPDGRIGVIHNGVDTSRFSPNAEAGAAVRAELNIAPDEFCIGCVGNLTTVKDYPTVLRATGEIAKSLPNWRVLVIGEGPERSRLEQMVGAHPEWRRRVLFLGLSTRVPDLLNATDVYVLSSLTEGISNSLLEAMASARPVVATATGGNPEVVVDGRSGILFPVGDAQSLAGHLLRLWARPEERARLGEQALRRVRADFSLDAMIRNYECLYKRLMRPSKAQPSEVTCS